MTIESQEDIEGLQRVGKVVSRALREMLAKAKPGVTTGELDEVGERILRDHGARSAPRLTYNFPGATCISINEQAAHGIPGQRVIQPGDVVNVDVSAELDGYFADTGGTCVVPPTTPLKTRLCDATKQALTEAMQQARAGVRMSAIGAAIQRVAKRHLFKTIANLGSHGVGRALHEPPEHIPSYFDPNDRRVLQAGMVITIEPFLSTKSRFVKEAADGWSLVAAPGNFSAQYEHTLVITRHAPIIVTQMPCDHFSPH